MARNRLAVTSVAAAITACWVSAAAEAAAQSPKAIRSAERTPADFSSQHRPVVRRARTRIEVRPAPGPLRRECVPVFQERWIPAWGGRVLYASQRCWWTRG